MKTVKSILIKYLISWFFLSLIFLFLSENITKLIAPGFDSVELWIIVVITGLSAIFLIIVISFFIAFIKLKKKRQLK